MLKWYEQGETQKSYFQIENVDKLLTGKCKCWPNYWCK